MFEDVFGEFLENQSMANEKLGSELGYGDSERWGGESVWTDRRGRKWLVVIAWAAVGGRFEPIGVTVAATSKGAVITGETLKAVPLGGVADQIRRDQADVFAEAIRRWDQIRPEEFADPAAVRSVIEADRRSALELSELMMAHKGRTLTRDDLAAVASVYREAHRVGADPRAAVREQFHLSDSGAAKRIRAARDAGVLGPARPGKAGEA